MRLHEADPDMVAYQEIRLQGKDNSKSPVRCVLKHRPTEQVIKTAGTVFGALC